MVGICRDGLCTIEKSGSRTAARRGHGFLLLACMFHIQYTITRLLRRRTQVAKGEVCKTSIQRFESARRLQLRDEDYKDMRQVGSHGRKRDRKGKVV